jgi:hypothetical protein
MMNSLGTSLAVVWVGLLMMFPGAVLAKPSHCQKDCKQDIKTCLGSVPPNKDCTGTKTEKKACRKMYAAERKTCRGLVKRCKEQNPTTRGVCVPTTTVPCTCTTDAECDDGIGCTADRCVNGMCLHVCICLCAPGVNCCAGAGPCAATP